MDCHNELLHRRARQGGFTLIEILIVVFIIGLLAALVGPQLFKRVGGAKQKMARTQIEVLGTALDTYRLDVGQYPSSEQGLTALVTQPGDVQTWDGPYLRKEVPADPWGSQYIYRSPGEHGEYDLLSLGADKAEGGEGENQDVASWEN
ncbi:general secretion pathway protein G [Desulfocurvibacter africanus PCS]|uniref:Type II secretion system core protein G n=1 Tax=Desulfocurvibacter africanus PCS TaxID=1262666 RepID=M5Q3V1_DESAF|nr:type II secretion system major pseudopilin GspG [Desulfocurvibacter africanus]EMG39088.1 general secretion pathway protein G [Desulfocurvibacter africanus PCS]